MFDSGLSGVYPENISRMLCDEFNPQVTLLVQLSDGVDPGKFEAFEDFHQSFGWVNRNLPKKQFQIIPFSIDKDGGVKAYLMVEQLKVSETP